MVRSGLLALMPQISIQDRRRLVMWPVAPDRTALDVASMLGLRAIGYA